VTWRGVAYAKNQVLTGPQIAALPRLSALLSKGLLETVPDVYGRRSKRPRPTHLGPVTLDKLT
jgi:hypothetical protein